MTRAVLRAPALTKARLLAVASVLAACLIAVAPAAEAASHAGDLRLKGPANSAYTQGPYVSQVGTPGTVLTYTTQVVNTGGTVAQFRVRVVSPIPADVYDGSFALTPLAASPDGYYTKALAPGANQVLTVKVRVPTSTSQHVWETNVVLYATDGTFLEELSLLTGHAAMKGHESFDLYAKSGGQKTIGAPWHDQVMTAPTITPTGTATFTVTLQNNGVNAQRTYFVIVPAISCSNFTLTVKDGLKNVTAAALAGTYATPVLNVGASRNLTVTVKASGTGCPYTFFQVAASPDGVSFPAADILLVNLTA